MNRRAFIGTTTVAAAGALLLDWRDVWAQSGKGVPGATVKVCASSEFAARTAFGSAADFAKLGEPPRLGDRSARLLIMWKSPVR